MTRHSLILPGQQLSSHRGSPLLSCRRLPCLVWVALMLLLFLSSLCTMTSASSLKQLCEVDQDWRCAKKDTDAIPRHVKEVCQTCASYWSSVPGIDLCCRCSDTLFAYCYEAIYGQKLALHKP